MADTAYSASERSGRSRRTAKDWDRIAVRAVVVGGVLRVIWGLAVHPPTAYVYSDMRGYVARAAGLAYGAPLAPVDAFFPPGTQFLLAVPIGLFGLGAGLWVAAVLWCLLSIITVYMAWRLARTLLSPAAAALTAVACAAWPLFITYGGYFTSETPATAFLIGAVWTGVEATRRQGGSAVALAASSGLLGGVAAAVRPQLLLNVLLVAAAVFLAARRRVLPIGGLIGGLVVVLALVVVHNSLASGQLSNLARNGGVNFWFGHCDARSVATVNALNVRTYAIQHPVPAQAGRPGDFVVRNHDVWDEDVFMGLGWDCIAQDGVGHVLRLARNVLDMTATTTPWPQSESAGWSQQAVQAANVLYAVLLPWIVIESITLVRRRRRARGEAVGETFMLLNLACAAVVAVLVIGDPRVRAVYDVFGLALLAVLLADRFRLDDPAQQDEPATADRE